MSASMLQCLTVLEKQIKELKVEISKETEKKSEKTTEKKPKKIEECTTPEQLNKYFTVAELKEWLKKKKINVKKVNEKHKNDFVKIVWENISDEYESDYSDESEDESGDESEDDEWEYYYA
jgi:hypothetical protein